MIIIIDGPDNCGKTTQIAKLQPLLIDKPLHLLHYTKLKGFDSNNEMMTYSKNMYYDMFRILESNYKTSNFILDRSHISEIVYSPLYRDYSGDYIYDIERKFLTYNHNFWEEIYLIVFIDEAEALISRDDGLSHSVNLVDKEEEINMFRGTTIKSLIINKIIININGKSQDEVAEETKSFLNL